MAVVRTDALLPLVEPDQIAIRTRRSLKRQSRNIYEITADLRGFGPFAELETAGGAGAGVIGQLDALDRAVSTLSDELRSMRADYLKAQLELLGVSSQSRDLSLHIGCGSRHLQGWINIDNYPAPLSMSALWNLPFADRSTVRVLVSRIPESSSSRLRSDNFWPRYGGYRLAAACCRSP